MNAQESNWRRQALPMGEGARAATRTAELPPGTLETDAIEVRHLTLDDLESIVRIDREWTGRRRVEYYTLKLKEAERDTSVRISLVARIEKQVVGFVLGRLYYGEFGRAEPVAMLDSIGVSKTFAGRYVGEALLRQFRMNLEGLGVDRIQTEVEWSQFDLMRFFGRQGFRPAQRMCLELALEQESE